MGKSVGSALRDSLLWRLTLSFGKIDRHPSELYETIRLRGEGSLRRVLVRDAPKAVSGFNKGQKNTPILD